MVFLEQQTPGDIGSLRSVLELEIVLRCITLKCSVYTSTKKALLALLMPPVWLPWQLSGVQARG